MRITLPKEVNEIIDRLEKAGFEAYAVGGCVRDCLLGREPMDWDITTSADPERVKKVFPVTIDTGIEHGTVTVRLNKKSFEVTTFRADGEYRDGRHPESVTFVKSLKEDLRRRDFTINAMAYNETLGLVDEFEGAKDLEAGIIRCVEDPLRRFSEDALRMLRALRFSAQLGFSLDKATEDAIKTLHMSISKVSAERIREELLKLICSDRPEKMFLLWETGLSTVFLPEWDAMVATSQVNKHHRGTVAEHTVYVMENVEPTVTLRLAALLHDVGKPVCKKTDPKGVDHFAGHPRVGEAMARDILRRLKMDNATTDLVCRLVRFHDERPELNKRTVRRLVSRVGGDLVPLVLALRRGDILGQSDYKQDEKLAAIDRFELLYKDIISSKEALSVKDLAVSGRDLMELGLSGPAIGEALKSALDLVLERPEANEKDELIAYIKGKIK